MKKNIFITAVGGDIAQSIIKCLKDRRRRIRLIGCDVDPHASGRNEVDEFIIAPKALKHKEYTRFMDRTIRKFNIGYICPASEDEITLFNKRRDLFKKGDTKLFLNTSFIMDTFLDKYKTAGFLRECGLPHPSTFLLEDYQGQLKCPLIIKPRKGHGSEMIKFIKDKEEPQFYKGRLKEFVVQEYLNDREGEYTTGVFSDGRDVRSITFKRRIGFNGVSKRAELIEDGSIEETAERIARCSNLAGSINIQSRKVGGKFVVFEVNPRFSSTVYSRHIFGFRDVCWWLDLLDRKRSGFSLKYKKGVVVRRLTEVFLDFQSSMNTNKTGVAR